MKYYPLSQAQIRIWYEQKRYGNSSIYNIGGSVEILGNADLATLKKAIRTVYRNNIAMRLRFLEKDNVVHQYISKEALSVEKVDFIHFPNPWETFGLWCEAQAVLPFVMENAPLCYFAVFRLTGQDTGYFIKLHHIIADGWSVKLLTDQVAQAYESIVKNRTEIRQPIPSYLDMIKKEINYLQSDACALARTFWMDKLYPVPEVIQYGERIEGSRKTYFMESEIQMKLENYLHEYRISINTFFLGIYLIYEYKKSGRQNIAAGIPLLGRTGKKEKQIFGTFTNTMPYHCLIQKEKSVCGFMKEIDADMITCLRHQKYPYNMVHKDLALSRSGTGTGSLYRACINYYNTVICSLINGMPTRNKEFYSGQQEYPLQIIIRRWNESRLQLDFDYQKALYSKRQIQDMYEQLIELIIQVLTDETKTIKELQLVGEEERKKYLVDYNNTETLYPAEETLIHIFLKYVKIQPHLIAVSKGSEYMSYHRLNQISDRAADELKVCGVKKGDIVALIPEYSTESIAIILSIWKCGAVYLPVEKDLPEERKKRILLDAEAGFLVAEKEVDFYVSNLISYSQLLEDKKYNARINLAKVEDIAYLLYTSGSGGDPKGVMVTHRSLINYLWWAAANYRKHEKETFPLYSSFSFDFTLTSFLLPLISGDEIRIFENVDNWNVFQKIQEDGRATILKITPSHIPLMKAVNWKNSAVHTVIVGGEELKNISCKELYELFEKKINIYNEYGPTEATIGCMTYHYHGKETGASVPIGRPIANTQIYILDHDFNPVPYDTIGELYIGGVGLAKGYRQAEGENDKRFLQNPFKMDARIYKTGDLAYRNQQGDIVFHGRCDRQIKIRGHRISLPEIEENILRSKLVREAYVKAIEIEKESLVLCAYLIGIREQDKPVLKEFLIKILPAYMVPELYVILEMFPINRNGKLDSDRLPLPESSAEITMDQCEKKYEILFDSVKALFPQGTITSGSNFYELGGDSIKAILLSSRLQEMGYELPVNDILKYPDLQELSMRLKEVTVSRYEQGTLSGDVKDIPIIQWFMQEVGQKEHYNISLLLEWKQEISVETLETLFKELIRHHDGLRINVKNSEKLFYNNKHLETDHVVQVISCDFNSESLHEIIRKNTKQQFDYSKDLLIRPYFIIKGQKKYMYIIMHHLITDSISMRILMEDLERLWIQNKEMKRLKMSEKTASYKEYADNYHEWVRKTIVDKSYWEEILAETPGKNNMAECMYGETCIKYFQLSSEDTEKLLGKALLPFDITAEELILAALATAYCKFTGLQKIVVEVEGHGRDMLEDININRTIGWFTAIYPIMLKISEEDRSMQMRELINQIKIAVKRKSEYGIWKYHSAEKPGNGIIRFNYLGKMTEYSNSVLELCQFMRADDVAEENLFRYLADINAYIREGSLTFTIRYGKLKEKYRIELTEMLHTELQNIIDFCVNLETRVYTPADFELVNLSQKELDILLE